MAPDGASGSRAGALTASRLLARAGVIQYPAGGGHGCLDRPRDERADLVHDAVDVAAGFAVLAGASLGLLLVDVTTPLWVTAVIFAARGGSIGLFITPLLFTLAGPLPPGRMADASTLFNVLQRIAGSVGIGLLAAIYTSLAPSQDPSGALHVTGIVVA